MIPLVIGHPRAIIVYVTDHRLPRGTYVAIYVRNAHEALRGRAPADVEIVYVEGADLVLQQPGVREMIGYLAASGAKETVHSA